MTDSVYSGRLLFVEFWVPWLLAHADSSFTNPVRRRNALENVLMLLLRRVRGELRPIDVTRQCRYSEHTRDQLLNWLQRGTLPSEPDAFLAYRSPALIDASIRSGWIRVCFDPPQA